ncbi:LTA synthase family protein [Thermococcus zilligii]|uniref:hypothetical protein n=1 Tax=Thermococcus zilligii TaxID=54076 RepID=UPI00029B1DF2|nr:hypothetical protein [Thermococcus zilligii]
MRIIPVAKHYSKVFLSFLLLVFLVAVMPAMASALINQATEMRLGEFSGEYFSFRFVPKDYNGPVIAYLKNGESLTGAEPPRPAKRGSGFSVDGTRAMFANAGINVREVYLPLYVSDGSSPWIILVPLLEGEEGADCYVSDEKAKDKTERAEIRYYYTHFASNSQADGEGVATIKVGPVKVLQGSDERSRVLRAILKGWEKSGHNACMASPDFARRLLEPYGVDLGELSIGNQGVIVITDGGQGVEEIHRALSREAANYNLSLVMRVVTPRWVFALESSDGGGLWNYLWGYVALLLPVLPALLIIMGREKEDEERMRRVISTNGGRGIVLDLITVGTVLFALALTALLLDKRASLLSAVILLLVYVLRNFVAGRELGKGYAFAASLLVVLGILGVFLHYNFQLRLYTSGIIGHLSSLGSSDASVLISLVAFRYLPGVLISIGALSLAFLVFGAGKPQHRALARLLFPGVTSIGVLFLYTSLLFSAPLVSLTSVTDYIGGATGAIGFYDSDSLSKAYNLTLEAVTEKNVAYATLWRAGDVTPNTVGMTYSTGALFCYDRDFLEFLRKTSEISITAGVLYSKLSSKEIVVPRHYLENLKNEGLVRTSGDVLTFTVMDDDENPHEVSAPYETVEVLPFEIEALLTSCEVAKKYGLEPRPAYLLLRGSSEETEGIIKTINGTIAPKYPDAFGNPWFLGDVSAHVRSQFEDPRSVIPFILSGLLMAITGIVAGLRDREKVSGLAELMRTNGEEPLLSLVPVLLPVLALAYAPLSMLLDGHSFASMGFVSGNLVLIGLAPLLGLLAGLVLYFSLLLWKAREV